MSTKKFLEKITHNWPVKVVCFAMAILIYFFHQMSTLGRRTFTVPLTVQANGSMVPASSEGSSLVKVTVRGKRDQLASVSESDFKVLLDISYQTEAGRYDFPVLVKPSERVLLMEPLEIKASPEKVSMSVEENIFRFVTVKPSVSGNVAYGYELAGLSVEPGSVRIDGPKSIVEKVNAIYTDAVDVENLSSDTVRSVRLVNTNRLITLGTTKNFNVQARIRPSGMTKSISAVEISFENIPDALEIKSRSSSTIDVVLEGNVLELENVDSAAVRAYADCAFIGEEGTYDVPVVVSVPSKTSLASQSVSSVSVTVVHAEAESPETESPETDLPSGENSESDEAQNGGESAEEGSSV